MELGVALPTSARYASAESIARIAQEAERLGYTSLWTYERLLYPIAGVTQPDGSTWQLPESYKSVYEPIETLSYVAAYTQRVKLGTSIVNAPFQSPVLLARRFATLDRLSNGRVIAGLGQGWMEQEFATSNVSIKERGKRIEEYIAALRAIWGPDPVSFDGNFYHIPASLINPKPVQQGGIPILMGFNTLAAVKRAARLADILNPIAFTFEALESAVTTFHSAAREAGRDPCFLKHSKTCVTMLQYLLHRLTVSPDKSGQRSQLHKRIFVPTKPLPARPALLHQVYTSLHCRPDVVCCQQGLECWPKRGVCATSIYLHIIYAFFNHCC